MFSPFLGVSFTSTAYLSGTLFLCCCITSATYLREIFLSSGVFYLTLLPNATGCTFGVRTTTTHKAQQDVAPTCFQGFPGSRQFFLEVAEPPNCGSKHRPSPSVCLNHTVFSQRYYFYLCPKAIGRKLYQLLDGFELTL